MTRFESNKRNSGQGDEIKFWTELISPTEARQYLENQNKNRAASEIYVRKLSDDMKNGLWVENSEPIKFDSTGRLIDGQHRMHAIVHSKTTQMFTVLSGYSQDAMGVIDIGKPRTAAHIGQIQGLNIHQKHTACVSAMFLPSNKSISKTEIIQLFKTYEASIRFVIDYKPSQPSPNWLVAPLSALLAKAYYYENHKRLKEFMEVFLSGFPLNAEEDSAAIALANKFRLLREEDRFTMTYARRQDIFQQSQGALDKFIAREPCKSIHSVKRSVNRYPLPFIDEQTPDNEKRIKRDFLGKMDDDKYIVAF